MTHLRILVCDLDGTLMENDRMAPETWEALRRVKDAGFMLMLATGRRLETFDAKGLFAELCEAIVAEDGAVVYFPRIDQLVFPFGRLESTLLQRLAQLNLPLEYGSAIVASWAPHDAAIMQALRASGGGATVEYNRGAVMVLPSGATKGAGLRFALQELGLLPRNVVACGDAENDRSLFQIAEVAVAVANANPEIKAVADLVTPFPAAKGVEWLIERLLKRDLPPFAPRADRRAVLGVDLDENPRYLDPFRLVNGNCGLFGASASGKSWIAGLLAEQLITLGYEVYMIDPEGDYRGLRAFTRTLLLGGPQTPLPPVVDMVTLDQYAKISLVLDLSSYDLNARKQYVAELLRAVLNLRQRIGQPHWILLDEAHSLCPTYGGEVTQLCQALMQDGGIALVSYRPSLVNAKLLAKLDHWILACTRLPEEIKLIDAYLPESAEKSTLLAALPTLPKGQAYLVNTQTGRYLLRDEAVAFRVGQRHALHVRHLQKYLQAPLPSHKCFYFCDSSGRFIGKAAASLAEFNQLLAEAPIHSVEYHVARGDFERWLAGVLGDDELARRFRKIAHRQPRGETLRAELIAVTKERYATLTALM